MAVKALSFTVLCCILILACQNSESPKIETAQPAEDEPVVLAESESATQTVEVGCAMCIYEMEGIDKCTLAVKIDSTPYLVEGVEIHELGDAHAEDGLCLIAREAVVEGKLEGDEFIATKVEFEPQAT